MSNNSIVGWLIALVIIVIALFLLTDSKAEQDKATARNAAAVIGYGPIKDIGVIVHDSMSDIEYRLLGVASKAEYKLIRVVHGKYKETGKDYYFIITINKDWVTQSMYVDNRLTLRVHNDSHNTFIVGYNSLNKPVYWDIHYNNIEEP